MVSSRRSRLWTNAIVAFAAAYALSAAVWFPLEIWEDDPVRSPIGMSVTYGLAGVLGFAAMLAATRWRWVGRGLLLAAGVVMLLSFTTMAEVTTLAALSIGLTAAAFLLSIPFFGDTPPPRRG